MWNKGVGHIAGNVNSKTIRHYPVVTEVCVFYSRPATFNRPSSPGQLTMQDWLRFEWKRAGLTLKEANRACGVKDAASRKWLTSDHLWYMPSKDMLDKLVVYANAHGLPEGKPYFAQDGKVPVTANQWDRLHYTWNHQHGLTNVWDVPALRGSERIKSLDGTTLHPTQKPLVLMNNIIEAVSNEGDVVWEQFGGTCSATVTADKLKRLGFASEPNYQYYQAATLRYVVFKKRKKFKQFLCHRVLPSLFLL